MSNTPFRILPTVKVAILAEYNVSEALGSLLGFALSALIKYAKAPKTKGMQKAYIIK